jgi:hypothetical protein
MATYPSSPSRDAERAADALHQLKHLIHSDPSFAEALRRIETTDQAAKLIHQHGLEITPEVLWRHRGTLVDGGRPTWRG